MGDTIEVPVLPAEATAKYLPYARSYIGYDLFNTAALSGTDIVSATFTATVVRGTGAGLLKVGFGVSATGTPGDTYDWASGMSDTFTMANGTNTCTFSIALTLGAYLFRTVWVDGLEPATSWKYTSYARMSRYVKLTEQV